MDANDLARLLEEHTKQDRESFKTLDAKVDAAMQELAEIRARELAEIKATLRGQKGFIAGMIFVVSALVSALALGISWLKS